MGKPNLPRRRDFQTALRPRSHGKPPTAGKGWNRKRAVPLTDAQRAMVERYIHLIPIALRKRPKAFDDEEAESIARMALCEAVHGYRETNLEIEKCLISKMRLILIDAARATGFVRRRYRDGILIEPSYVRPLSIDDEISGSPHSASVIDPLDFAHDQERKDWHRAFHAVVNMSPVEDSLVIRMTLEGYTLRQIGEVLGVSESRVSQMRPGIFRLLAQRLRDRGLDQ